MRAPYEPLRTLVPAPSAKSERLAEAVRFVEAFLAAAAMAAMTILPLVNAAARSVGGGGLPGSIVYTQHLTLVVAFLGAAVAARRREHLSLSAAVDLLPERLRRWPKLFASAVAGAVAGLLAWAGLGFVRSEMQGQLTIGLGLPVWVVELVVPLGFAVVAWRLSRYARPQWAGLLGAALLLAGLFVVDHFELEPPGFFGAALCAIAVATLFGAPLFVTIGGVTMLLFWDQFTPISAVVVESYRLVSSPTLPAVPLFTLAGYLLAAGGASGRLVDLFEAWFGWAPGGMAVAAALVCAFFTTFTGASGVTILALGGLLLPALVQAGHDERFALGLVTSSGSLGLLFFPSLPVILYAVVAQVDVAKMFAGALLPGFVVVLSVAIFGVHYGLRHRERTSAVFDRRRALAALWRAKWEILLPVWVVAGFASGLFTFVESAAFAAAYALAIEALVYRDLDLRSGLVDAVVACVSLVGAVLTILGVALGFTSYLVDAEVPARLVAWTTAHVHSQLWFLLALNGVLLAVGCIMDIFSAIVVVAPLVLPVGAAFGVDPVHLGVIFLANLELGFITPPVGLNLFLSSMRFAKPLGEVYRSTVPFFFLRAAAVLIITYVPFLSTALAGLVGGN